MFSRGRSSFWWKYCAYIPPPSVLTPCGEFGVVFRLFSQRLPSSRCVVSPRVCREERWRLVAPTKGSRGKPCGRRTCREISTYLGVCRLAFLCCAVLNVSPGVTTSRIGNTEAHTQTVKTADILSSRAALANSITESIFSL